MLSGTWQTFHFALLRNAQIIKMSSRRIKLFHKLLSTNFQKKKKKKKKKKLLQIQPYQFKTLMYNSFYFLSDHWTNSWQFFENRIPLKSVLGRVGGVGCVCVCVCGGGGGGVCSLATTVLYMKKFSKPSLWCSFFCVFFVSKGNLLCFIFCVLGIGKVSSGPP